MSAWIPGGRLVGQVTSVGVSCVHPPLAVIPTVSAILKAPGDPETVNTLISPGAPVTKPGVATKPPPGASANAAAHVVARQSVKLRPLPLTRQN